MEIGSKLKEARTKTEYTQEQVAEEIGVSRQTVSNWENGKSYPDIVSLIHLSDLYFITLDELVKEDKKMIEHLDKATNEVRSRQRVIKILQVAIYLMFWVFCFMWFWLADQSEYGFEPAFTLLTFYAILPILSFVLALFIGKDDSWGKYRWVMILFFGFMYWLMVCGTFILRGRPLPMSLSYTLPGIASSALGMAIGLIARIITNFRNKYGV